MRAERVTPRTAAAAWNAVVKTYRGAVKLPALDIANLFGGRKTITWREALAGITREIAAANR
jgi:hypothetical protein